MGVLTSKLSTLALKLYEAGYHGSVVQTIFFMLFVASEKHGPLPQ